MTERTTTCYGNNDIFAEYINSFPRPRAMLAALGMILAAARIEQTTVNDKQDDKTA